MKLRSAVVVAGLAFGLVSGAARAEYVFDISQIGNDTFIKGSGSINLTNFIPVNTYQQSNFINPGASALKIGSQTNATMYSGSFTYTNSLGSDPNRSFGLALGSGAPVGFDAYNGFVFVPENYKGGELGLSTSSLKGQGLSYFGLTAGTYVFTLNNTGGEDESRFARRLAFNDTILVNVTGPSTIPLPASAPMFGAALLALGSVGYGVKRKKASAAA